MLLSMAGSERPKAGKRRPSHDSLAETRVAPVVDELAETREGVALTTHLALLDAAEFEITRRGFAATRIEHVAERARVEVDVCAAHYPDMRVILRALNDRFIEQMNAAVDATTATGSWQMARVREVIEIAARSIIEVVHDRRVLLRAFLTQSESDPSLVAGLREIGAHMTRRLESAVSQCIDAPTPGSRKVGFSLLVSVALAHHTVLVGDDWTGAPFSREELAAETARLITAYLASDVLQKEA